MKAWHQLVWPSLFHRGMLHFAYHEWLSVKLLRWCHNIMMCFICVALWGKIHQSLWDIPHKLPFNGNISASLISSLQTIEYLIKWLVVRDAMALVWRHCSYQLHQPIYIHWPQVTVCSQRTKFLGWAGLIMCMFIKSADQKDLNYWAQLMMAIRNSSLGIQNSNDGSRSCNYEKL